MQMFDTAGQEYYAKLRPLSYPQTDVFLVVFSLVSLTSLENVENMWIPEIQKHCPDVPFILVGTKKTLRDEFDTHYTEYRSKGWEPVSRCKGIEMKKKLKAEKYIECDTRNKRSIQDVFLSAAKIVLKINDKIKDDIYRIGIYGDEQSGKTKLALRYIFGDIPSNGIPSNEEDFIKIVEIKNKLIKLTIDDSNSQDLSLFNGLIFVFDISNEKSIVNLRNLFKSVSNDIPRKIPFVLVANYGEMRNNSKPNKNNLIPIEKYDELRKEFKCELFEIKSISDDDIETIFYYIIKKFFNPQKKQKKKTKTKKIKK